MSEYKLTQKIIELSNTDNWIEARVEWKVDDMFDDPDGRVCACGHNPIKEVCVIANKLNGNTLEVGNCCVRKFLDLPSKDITRSLKRVRDNYKLALSERAIDWINAELLMKEKKDINTQDINEILHPISDWEYRFLMSTRNKSNLSEKQLRKRIQINRDLIRRISNL